MLTVVDANTPMSALTDEIIADIKQREADPGADLRRLTAAGIEAVFKVPDGAEWRRFKTLALDPAKQASALETLVFGCLRWPAATEFRVAINRRPALIEVFGNRLGSLAGANAEVEEKKL